MDVHRSARKHRIAGPDIRHAVENHWVASDINDDEPARTLYLGPDRAGNLLEVVVLDFDDGSELAIHAMKMRAQYEYLIIEALGDDDDSSH
jgi:hypothetical protein